MSKHIEALNALGDRRRSPGLENDTEILAAMGVCVECLHWARKDFLPAVWALADTAPDPQTAFGTALALRALASDDEAVSRWLSMLSGDAAIRGHEGFATLDILPPPTWRMPPGLEWGSR